MNVDKQVREAAQALLLAELERLGEDGRQALVDEWSTFLPAYSDLFAILSSQSSAPNTGNTSATSVPATQTQTWTEGNPSGRALGESDMDDDQDEEDDGEGLKFNSSLDLKS